MILSAARPHEPSGTGPEWWAVEMNPHPSRLAIALRARLTAVHPVLKDVVRRYVVRRYRRDLQRLSDAAARCDARIPLPLGRTGVIACFLPLLFRKCATPIAH